MNAKQQEALDAALTGKNLFLTGAAGVGKSYTLKEVIRRLKLDHSDKVMGITASTGIAATPLHGVTLFSLFRINPRKVHEEPRVNETWRDLDILVIEECSMITPRLFDYLNTQAKISRRSKAPFGGVQLILCGDFYQLPPIKSKQHHDPRDFIFETTVWAESKLICVELTQVYRQENQRFAQTLMRVRQGIPTLADNQFLRSKQPPPSTFAHNNPNKRQKSSTTESNTIEPTKLYCHREQVDKTNLHQMQKLKTRKHKFQMHISATGCRVTDALRTSVTRQIPVPPTVELRIGSQVLLAVNYSLKHKLPNGKRGVVLDFHKEDSFPIVQFDDCKVKIRPYRFIITISARVEIQAICIPLKLAWAATIHKSQGASIDYLDVNLTGAFAHGQVYVALSRATSPEHLTHIRLQSCKATRQSKSDAVLQDYHTCVDNHHDHH